MKGKYLKVNLTEKQIVAIRDVATDRALCADTVRERILWHSIDRHMQEAQENK